MGSLPVITISSTASNLVQLIAVLDTNNAFFFVRAGGSSTGSSVGVSTGSTIKASPNVSTANRIVELLNMVSPPFYKLIEDKIASRL